MPSRHETRAEYSDTEMSTWFSFSWKCKAKLYRYQWWSSSEETCGLELISMTAPPVTWLLRYTGTTVSHDVFLWKSTLFLKLNKWLRLSEEKQQGSWDRLMAIIVDSESKVRLCNFRCSFTQNTFLLCSGTLLRRNFKNNTWDIEYVFSNG